MLSRRVRKAKSSVMKIVPSIKKGSFVDGLSASRTETRLAYIIIIILWFTLIAYSGVRERTILSD
jgi:hypothetical protein